MSQTIKRHPTAGLVAFQAHFALTLAHRRRPWSLLWRGALLLLLLSMAAKDGIPAIHVSSGSSTVRAEFFRPSQLDALPGTFGLFVGFAIALYLGFISPLSVWRDCSPARRSPFWALPVDRGVHELARVGAGAAGLLASSLAIVLSLVTGALIGGHAASLGALPATAWLAFFVGPLLLYGLNSIAAVRTETPALWMFGGSWAVAIFLAILALADDGGAVGRLARALLDGPLSLFAAVAGPWPQILSAAGADAVEHWPSAAAIWMVLVIAGLLAATRLQGVPSWLPSPFRGEARVRGPERRR